MKYQMGIPIPPAKQQNLELYQTVATMPVGACIDIPYTRTPVANNLSRTFGYTFRQRKVGDVLRIWRTA